MASCMDRPLKPEARRFLAGLSCDELQFIAEFVGASILESAEPCSGSRLEIARRVAAFQQARVGSAPGSSPDQDHKTILLLEFLCRAGLDRQPAPIRAARV